MRLSRWLVGPALVLSLVSFPAVGDASPAPAKAPAKADSNLTVTPVSEPKVKLDGPQHGKAALKALGGKLSVAAKQNGKSTAKLHAILSNDPTAWLDQSGQLFYADRFDAPATTARMSTSVPPAPEPLADTFALHSKPGSKHVVYLDFDGVYLNGGGWVYSGYKNGTYKGFSLDSDYTTFSDADRSYIQHVWQLVADKYAPFDIDVTTHNPGSAAYNRAGAGDDTYGDHVVFTDVTTGSGAKPSKICPYGCDGIAYNSSFNDPTDNTSRHEPTWVYTAGFKWYAALAGEIATHEVGHTLGLDHDGLGAGGGAVGSGDDEYYQGTDLWSPVMGSGFGAITQFSKGEYAGADNPQDDLAVIAAHGAPVRPDDEGSPGSPIALNAAASYARDGVIEDAADKDVFSIDRTCTSSLTARATSIGAGRSLDLQLRVLAADGTTVLGSDNPTTSANTSTFPRTPRGADAEVTVTTPPTGTIQVEVDGVGQGDPATDADGYSDYGSVGGYHLTITGCSGVSGATPGAVAAFSAAQPSPTSSTLNLTWQAPADPGDSPITGYRIYGAPSGAFDVADTETKVSLTSLEPGTDYDLSIAALNQYGEGTKTDLTKHLGSWGPVTAPKLKATAHNRTVELTWTEPSNPGRAIGTVWNVRVYGGGELLDSFTTEYGRPGVLFTGFTTGHYQLKAFLSYDDDYRSHSATGSTYVDVGPTAPRMGRPSSGTAGGTKTATVRWGAPSALHGSTVTSYDIGAYKLSSSGRIVDFKLTHRSASSRSYTWTLPGGRWVFRLQAHSTAGLSPISGYSRVVTSQ